MLSDNVTVSDNETIDDLLFPHHRGTYNTNPLTSNLSTLDYLQLKFYPKSQTKRRKKPILEHILEKLEK